MDKKGVGYGSLYMDQGEGWKKAKVQLDFILKQPIVIGLFFDVLAWPYQEKEALEMVERIKEYAKKLKPDIEKLSVSYTPTTKLHISDRPKN